MIMWDRTKLAKGQWLKLLGAELENLKYVPQLQWENVQTYLALNFRISYYIRASKDTLEDVPTSQIISVAIIWLKHPTTF